MLIIDIRSSAFLCVRFNLPSHAFQRHRMIHFNTLEMFDYQLEQEHLYLSSIEELEFFLMTMSSAITFTRHDFTVLIHID